MLAGWRKRDTKSNEASVKYYLLGVFASAVMLYGMSLMYGTTKTTVLTGIADAIHRDGVGSAGALAIVFMLIGFAFKVSAVPFHQWAPDTYQGAPTPVTAFLSVASKAAGFVALKLLPRWVGRALAATGHLRVWHLAAPSAHTGAAHCRWREKTSNSGKKPAAKTAKDP
jgi:NADH:ubiquinone oxidoreductase subunit 2 (subunit N)